MSKLDIAIIAAGWIGCIFGMWRILRPFGADAPANSNVEPRR